MLITLVGCGKEKKKEEITKQISSLDEVATIEGFTLKNTEISYENNSTFIKSELTNNTDKSRDIEYVKVHIVYDYENPEDKKIEENELDFLLYYFVTIEPNETKTATTSIDIDFSKSKKIEYSFSGLPSNFETD